MMRRNHSFFLFFLVFFFGGYSGLAPATGPALATTFGNELELANCVNTYVPQGAGPFWGQLGCSGFIIMDAHLNVVCPKSLAFMEVRGQAFHHVEALLDVLIESDGLSPPKRAKHSSADTDSEGEACSTTTGS